MPDQPQPTEHLNLEGVPCPTNFVKIKLQLEELEDGQILEIIIDDGEPIQSVPSSLKQEGHRLFHAEPCEHSTYRLLVEKGGQHG